MVLTHTQNLSTQATISDVTGKSVPVAYTKTKLRDINPRMETRACYPHSRTSTQRVPMVVPPRI